MIVSSFVLKIHVVSNYKNTFYRLNLGPAFTGTEFRIMKNSGKIGRNSIFSGNLWNFVTFSLHSQKELK